MAIVHKLFCIWIFYISLFVATSHAAGSFAKLDYKCEDDADCPNVVTKLICLKCINRFCHIIYKE
uniref:Nodule-specific cysteine-rich peptide L35 n=1 Tax=Lens culinaris TaxID=3864 RepID=A0A7T8DV92_LENCU|nr:nodule-specific cysteine-rich peptide L35 [Lens culinaris]